MKFCSGCGATFTPSTNSQKYCTHLCGNLTRQRLAYLHANQGAAATHNARAQKSTRIDLGLAISAATLPPGQSRTCAEISRFCECSKQAIDQIYASGLQKLRSALRRKGLIPSR